MRIDTMKIIRIATYALMVLLMIAAAAHAGDLLPSTKIVSENQGLFQWILGLALLGNLFLVSKMIKTSEKNNDMVWESIGGMNKAYVKMHDKVLVLETEHRMNHKEKKHEVSDDGEE